MFFLTLGTDQLSIFIRASDAKFETKELVSMNSLHKTTTGRDVFKEVEN